MRITRYALKRWRFRRRSPWSSKKSEKKEGLNPLDVNWRRTSTTYGTSARQVSTSWLGYARRVAIYSLPPYSQNGTVPSFCARYGGLNEYLYSNFRCGVSPQENGTAQDIKKARSHLTSAAIFIAIVNDDDRRCRWLSTDYSPLSGGSRPVHAGPNLRRLAERARFGSRDWWANHMTCAFVAKFLKFRKRLILPLPAFWIHESSLFALLALPKNSYIWSEMNMSER